MKASLNSGNESHCRQNYLRPTLLERRLSDERYNTLLYHSPLSLQIYASHLPPSPSHKPLTHYLNQAAMTARWLSKSWGAPTPSSRVIVCTGERMESLITKLYRPQDVRTTTYEPRHSKGLSNEFLCYANFECERWTWKGKGPDALAPS